ncbi:MAG TPA: deoxyribose-phosphate aldolase [Bacillota bacterium]|nr:deoxyribose-phosphate aldolase [Bacillota bacterium]HPT34803.1 deoxyribose-phosphate aldolase [Bacillota bacterium]HQD06178.1 deoxyribose-phosphate aldolase [Bacillota bacterium]
MSINRYIDHTLLKPEATEAQIVELCREAVRYQFASVCINPCYIAVAARELRGSGVKTGTVIGFPLGATTREVKVFEAEQAMRNGAEELDMVMNIGALKAGLREAVAGEIRAVVEAARGKALVKVIIECCLLTEEEKIAACQIVQEAGANFVKTSTGFASGGATVKDVRLIRQTVGPDMGIKASGGIRDYRTALAMIEAGANRIGTSSGVAIFREANP